MVTYHAMITLVSPYAVDRRQDRADRWSASVSASQCDDKVKMLEDLLTN
jgi:hypothetical protein